MGTEQPRDSGRIVLEKVEKINKRNYPIQEDFKKILTEYELDLTATTDARCAYKNAEFVVFAAPTNCDLVNNYISSSHVEVVIDSVLK